MTTATDIRTDLDRGAALNLLHRAAADIQAALDAIHADKALTPTAEGSALACILHDGASELRWNLSPYFS